MYICFRFCSSLGVYIYTSHLDQLTRSVKAEGGQAEGGRGAAQSVGKRDAKDAGDGNLRDHCQYSTIQ